MTRTVLAMVMLAACSDPSATEIPSPVQPTTVDSQEELVEPPAEAAAEPTVEPPQLTDRDLDAMDAPALEAACFNGSSAACDRLGH